MTVSHESVLNLLWQYKHSDGDNLSTPSDNGVFQFQQKFADGSGNNQMQDMYRVQGSVSPGEGNEDTYDLAGGIVDEFGNTITLATLKLLVVVNNATTNGEDITIGGPSGGTTGSLITDLFDGDNDSRIKVKADGFEIIGTRRTGYTVTGGSDDILVITNGGTAAISYDLYVAGTR